jgi:hypothetical protein
LNNKQQTRERETITMIDDVEDVEDEEGNDGK